MYSRREKFALELIKNSFSHKNLKLLKLCAKDVHERFIIAVMNKKKKKKTLEVHSMSMSGSQCP